MPPKRKKTPTKEGDGGGDAMANCVLPSDMLLCILSRLPVKSIHRFKAVCKPWRNLFATPSFIKLHHGQFSKNRENRNFMIYSFYLERGPRHTMSLFRIEHKSNELQLKITNLGHHMDFVGSIGGLICLSYHPIYGRSNFLWNPALKLEKRLQSPNVDFRTNESGDIEWVSVGFGYDDEAHDFKVVRIGFGCLDGKEMKVGAEVYSTIADSWREINTGLKKFMIRNTKCDAIVGGNPYWIVKAADEDGSIKSHILWFDAKKSTFEMVCSSNVEMEQKGELLELVDWKGSLATIVCNGMTEMGEIRVASVLVFDVDEKMWYKNYVFGPFVMNAERYLLCSNYGLKLFLLGSWAGRVKVTEQDGANVFDLTIHEYSESLATVNGMGPLEVLKPAESEDDHEEIAVFFRTFMQSYMQFRALLFFLSLASPWCNLQATTVHEHFFFSTVLIFFAPISLFHFWFLRAVCVK